MFTDTVHVQEPVDDAVSKTKAPGHEGTKAPRHEDPGRPRRRGEYEGNAKDAKDAKDCNTTRWDFRFARRACPHAHAHVQRNVKQVPVPSSCPPSPWVIESPRNEAGGAGAKYREGERNRLWRGARTEASETVALATARKPRDAATKPEAIAAARARGVAQLGLERCVRDAEAAGSNPVAPTILKSGPFGESVERPSLCQH